MKQKSIAPQEQPNQIARWRELTEKELGRAIGSAATNPLYTPLTQGGTNPLYQGS